MKYYAECFGSQVTIFCKSNRKVILEKKLKRDCFNIETESQVMESINVWINNIKINFILKSSKMFKMFKIK